MKWWKFLFCGCFGGRQDALVGELELPQYNDEYHFVARLPLSSYTNDLEVSEVNLTTEESLQLFASNGNSISKLHALNSGYNCSFPIGTFNIGDRASKSQNDLFDHVFSSMIKMRPPQVLFLQESRAISTLSKSIRRLFIWEENTITNQRIIGHEKTVFGNTRSVTLLSQDFTIINKFNADDTLLNILQDIGSRHNLEISNDIIEDILKRSLFIKVKYVDSRVLLLVNFHGRNNTSNTDKILRIVSLLKLLDVYSKENNLTVILGGDFNFPLLSALSPSLCNFIMEFLPQCVDEEFLYDKPTTSVQLFDLLNLENIEISLTNDDFGRDEAIDFLLLFKPRNENCSILDLTRLRWTDQESQHFSNTFYHDLSYLPSNVLNHPFVSGIFAFN
ncbi:hypothetical protein RCL1_005995 [Eukaryota sp. TZLM3-RCL]